MDSRGRLLILGAVMLLALAALWAFPKIITGDYAQITITQADIQPDGKVTLHFVIESSYHTAVVTGIYDGDDYKGGGPVIFTNGLFGRPNQTTETLTFQLAPDHDASTPPDDTSWQKRLMLHAGDTRKIHPGNRLYFYDFKTANEMIHYGYIEVENPKFIDRIPSS